MHLSIDIGGTQTRIAVFENENMLYKDVFLTNVNDLSADVINVYNLVSLKNFVINSIGIACPGPLNVKTGVIYNSPNLQKWNEQSISKEYSKVFQINEIKINNDANVAALGQFFKREPIHSLVYFTISTGIGAGYILEGKIIDGFNGCAFEIANAIPDPNSKNPLQSGIEYWASGKNIVKQLSKLGVEVKGSKEAFEIFESKNNEIVNKFFEDIETKLVQLFATTISFLDPQIIVVGGSVAINNKNWFQKIFKRTQNLFSYSNYVVHFEFASDLDNATLDGCRRLFI